jgi:hypothetical protein
MDRLNSHFLHPLTPETSQMAGNQTVLVATRDDSANQPVMGAATELSLLTGLPDSSGGCQSAVIDKLGVSPSQYYHPRSTSQITQG